MSRRSLAVLSTLWLTTTLALAGASQAPSKQAPSRQASSTQTPSGEQPLAPPVVSGAEEPRIILRTTVRRLVLDVVVTGPNSAPVPNLNKVDFLVSEDGKPQQVLSCEANGFSAEMDYLPPKLPPQPPNTFINLPATPEKGPLYVLLYDLVNLDTRDQMDSPEDHSMQMIARQQITKFIQSKPDGARFAIFVRTDGLHLIQGFTSDKALLYKALDPHNPKAHIPMVFLMGENYGQGDRFSALNTLHSLATYLDGLQGRKNLIWFSSAFPLSLFAQELDGVNFQQETRTTLDLLARNQIAVYPVDARGVAANDSHAALGDSVRGDATSTSSPGANAAAASGPSSPFVQGTSSVMSRFDVMHEIAREPGGRAFHGTNDVAGALVTATESGAVYYTLTYSPTNSNYDGKLRNIKVELAKKGYELSYRRFYYGLEMPTGEPSMASANTPIAHPPEAAQRPVGDTLSANMQHGAPAAHDLVFVVQAHAVGRPAEGTPEQMAELATEPAYFKSRRKTKATKPLVPIPLQREVFSFSIPTRQFKGRASLDLEVAAAVYDADGRMMNAVVGVGKKDLSQPAGANEPARFYRVEQELEVPQAATSIRFAVRDTTNDRLGAMEVALPLSSENASPAADPTAKE